MPSISMCEVPAMPSTSKARPTLQNQSELRAPTAEKAAFFLDAAIASRRSHQQDCDEDDHRNSHMFFTLHIYQYRMEKSGKGGSKSTSTTRPLSLPSGSDPSQEPLGQP
ncbi:Kinesin-like protein kif26b [Saguinus oedipus]|uniref:Kinesin-like protein kif26b n=1 Tax=Saguinus oedipus TaxID=9490 RepID=A0ABQ9TN19_SAGOE|nr:Kinesin-like protein kif26b [Saguinus oedipus]